MREIYLTAVLMVLCFMLSNRVAGQQISAFPGADGFGKYTTGGRGGSVIEVTNLNDNGAGSLRSAVTTNGPRTIVFRVSGTIYLQSALQISKNDVTIAGQTAPGQGITIANYNMKVNADNVIIRYIRCRMGDNYKQAEDAFTCTEHKNIIIDHCSFSWSVDEAASAYLNENFTMQWCIISESLYNSCHPKGAHGYGGIWGGNKASFHHNLFAHHTSRNPRFNGARYAAGWTELTDFRNNVIYNWGFNSAYGGEPSELDGNKAYINVVANYYKPGPATSKNQVHYRILEPSMQPVNGWGYSYFYVDSNYMAGSSETTLDNWTYGVQSVTAAEKAAIKSSTPFSYLISSTDSAKLAYTRVLNNAGARLPFMDTLDRRIVWEVINDTAIFGSIYGKHTGIIDSQNDVGGYPELFSDYPSPDSDHDGMPDEWEVAHSLNPKDSTDRNNNLNGDGYTALEVYINGITEYGNFLYSPSQLQTKLLQPKAVKISWKDNSADETGFVIEKKILSSFEIIDTIAKDSTNYIDTLLQANTYYYYRVRAIKNSDSSVYSKEIKILTPTSTGKPSTALYPVPANNSSEERVSIKFTWTPGSGVQWHDIYFDTINPPKFYKKTTDTSFSPGYLKHNSNYYWKVTEVNDFDSTIGEIWCLKTRAEIQNKLVGHWSFDTAMQAHDISGFGNNGILNNIYENCFIDSGAINKALNLNGLDQYIKIPHSSAFDFDVNDFTISFWMKMDPALVDRLKSYRFVVKGSNVLNSSLGRTGRRYEVYYTPAKNIFRFAVDDNINKSEITTDETIFINGKWLLVTAIRDKSKGVLRLYADTSNVAETADITGDISQNEDLYFSYCVDESSYLTGGLDDVRLYGYALSKKEIDSLYSMADKKPVETKLTYTTSAINVYPNPVYDKCIIFIKASTSADISLFLTDVNGKIIDKITQKISFSGNYIINYSLPYGLKSGIYLLSLNNGNDVVRTKLLKN